MSTQSIHRCPVCGNNLRVEREGSLIWVWCSVGRCPSSVANDGGCGVNELEAFAALQAACDEEMDDQD